MTRFATVQEAGAIKNIFGLVTSDHKKLVPEKMREFVGVTKTDLAKIFNAPRAAMYRKDVKLADEFVKGKLIPIVVASDMAVDLFDDTEKARAWILTPNSYFFGKSPFDMCLLGEGKAVIEFLFGRLGSDGQIKKSV